MKTINTQQFKVDNQIKLNNCPTKLSLEIKDKKVEKELKDIRKKLGKLQDTLYAHGKYAVLVCLQGMDTSGKDSLIREVFKGF